MKFLKKRNWIILLFPLLVLSQGEETFLNKMIGPSDGHVAVFDNCLLNPNIYPYDAIYTCSSVKLDGKEQLKFGKSIHISSKVWDPSLKRHNSIKCWVEKQGHAFLRVIQMGFHGHCDPNREAAIMPWRISFGAHAKREVGYESSALIDHGMYLIEGYYHKKIAENKFEGVWYNLPRKWDTKWKLVSSGMAEDSIVYAVGEYSGPAKANPRVIGIAFASAEVAQVAALQGAAISGGIGYKMLESMDDGDFSKMQAGFLWSIPDEDNAYKYTTGIDEVMDLYRGLPQPSNRWVYEDNSQAIMKIKGNETNVIFRIIDLKLKEIDRETCMALSYDDPSLASSLGCDAEEESNIFFRHQGGQSLAEPLETFAPIEYTSDDEMTRVLEALMNPSDAGSQEVLKKALKQCELGHLPGWLCKAIEQALQNVLPDFLIISSGDPSLRTPFMMREMRFLAYRAPSGMIFIFTFIPTNGDQHKHEHRRIMKRYPDLEFYGGGRFHVEIEFDSGTMKSETKTETQSGFDRPESLEEQKLLLKALEQEILKFFPKDSAVGKLMRDFWGVEG